MASVAIEAERPQLAVVAGNGRLMSLDVFRGATVLLMVLVNNPGSWRAVYPPLRHAEWHGWTPTDLVFPFFLFIVGVSVVLSSRGRRERGTGRAALVGHAAWRSLLLIIIGIIMNGLFYLPWAEVRVPGVLQRIGIVYLATVLLTLTALRTRVALTVALLAGYWALMTLVPAPGHVAGDLSPGGNLASWLDRRLLAGHLWRPEWDPEGLLSTLPAVATALLGTLAGEWLAPDRAGSSAPLRRHAGARGRTPRSKFHIAAGLVLAGLAGIAVGQLWGVVFPINKNLWTSSFAVFTAGWAALALGACYALVEVRGWRRWARPLAWVGMNPLAIYVGSELLGLSALDKVRHWIYATVLAPVAGAPNASLLWALAYVGLWWAVAWTMYRKTIFIKL